MNMLKDATTMKQFKYVYIFIVEFTNLILGIQTDCLSLS